MGGYTQCGHFKKLSVVRGKWQSTLPLARCKTPRAKAAYRWLYEFNMTYRYFVGLHRGVLNAVAAGERTELFEPTHKLLLEHPGIEVAAFPFLYPWAR